MSKKGFDIVVGNPPYIRQEKINDIKNKSGIPISEMGIDHKELLNNIHNKKVKTDANSDNELSKTMDFSMYFIVRSRQLSQNNGHHSFIITNKWLRASYGEPIRHFLKHKVQLTKFIDFVNCNIFRGASVDTVVFSFIKSDNINGKISFCCPASLDEFAESDHDYYCEQQLLDDKVWSFSDPLTEEIKQYIDSVGTPLKDMEVEINRGVTTGYNDAFLIKTDTRNRLIERDPKNDEIIKPLVKGKNINRYNIQWDDWWLLFIPWHFPLDPFEIQGASKEAEKEFKKQYPIIYEHLLQFKDRLMKRNKAETGIRYEWYALQRFGSTYYDDFEIPKIMWQEISPIGAYAWVNHPLYTVNTCYIMTSLPKSFLLQLNSKLVDFFFDTITANLGTGGVRHTDQYVNGIYLMSNIDSDIHSILVDYLHLNQDSFEDVSNCLVYELYFHSKFHEDGLYPEDEMYLLNAVKPHLKPIEYEEWSDLDWKRQLGEITDGEAKRLDELTKENERIIGEVVESLKNDDEINRWMKVIKSHEWVRKIEGEDND